MIGFGCASEPSSRNSNAPNYPFSECWTEPGNQFAQQLEDAALAAPRSLQRSCVKINGNAKKWLKVREFLSRALDAVRAVSCEAVRDKSIGPAGRATPGFPVIR